MIAERRRKGSALPSLQETSIHGRLKPLGEDLEIHQDVPLGPRTTLGLGGSARHLVRVDDEASLIRALRWAEGRELQTFILGGGSNLVVSDAGFDGLVIEMGLMGVSFTSSGSIVRVEAAAGECWDDLVSQTVERELAGLECLSGIPGLVGATPIQNVGAYAQEVSQTIHAVRVLERETYGVQELSREACAFAYRDSMFKREPGRYVVLRVSYDLEPGGAPAVRYKELKRALGSATPSLAEVRELILRLRRNKGMVIDPTDPDTRSAGSFFTNPILPEEVVAEVVARALQLGVVQAPEEVPTYPAGSGLIKLPAAWLIERAGIEKGYRAGQVGISSKHCLALVHYGGGRTDELIALAQEVQRAVYERWGVQLEPEPVRVGFSSPPLSASMVSK